MAKISDIIRENIQNYMTERFYIEGKDKDYYFGKSELNDDLTVFYNNMENEEATHCLGKTVREAVYNGFIKFQNEYGLMCMKSDNFSLSSSAFMIPVYSYKSYWSNDDDENYDCQINWMPTGILELAIKNNPERWNLYKKYRDRNNEF